MKESKLKTWMEEHRDEIKAESIRILWCAIGFGVAWFASSELTTRTNAMRVLELQNAGLLKFTNPSTGSEISIKEACEIANKIWD